MKPTTLLIVASSFIAGIAVGGAAPITTAGAGLLQVLSSGSLPYAHADRITASFDSKHGAFQQADFRWSVQQGTTQSIVCAPKDELAKAPIKGIEHL